MLQATLDEQRQARVHQVLLEKLQQKMAALSLSAPVAAGKDTQELQDVVALATSGDAQEQSTNGPNDEAVAALGAPTARFGGQQLAWGGADVVAFTRHSALLVTANPQVSHVQYPAEDGPWCVIWA
jgi:hypothetical protein